MRILITAGILISIGCTTGPAPNDHPLARSAAGSMAMVETNQGWRTGELLEVRDTALVIASTKEVVLVPLRVIRTIRFADLEYWYNRGEHGEEAIAAFKRISRFPGGAPSGVLDEIVRRSGRPLLVQQR